MSEPCRRCERFRVELADCKTLASAVIEQLTTERDGLLATIVRVKVIVDDPHAALVTSRIRAALNAPTEPPPPFAFPSLERGYAAGPGRLVGYGDTSSSSSSHPSKEGPNT